MRYVASGRKCRTIWVDDMSCRYSYIVEYRGIFGIIIWVRDVILICIKIIVNAEFIEIRNIVRWVDGFFIQEHIVKWIWGICSIDSGRNEYGIVIGIFVGQVGIGGIWINIFFYKQWEKWIRIIRKIGGETHNSTVITRIEWIQYRIW